MPASKDQSFSHLVDLTYPLTSQTVLTDGQVFSFLAYQLNTLELWKDDEANSMVNLCWHSKEMSLYHSVTDGKVNDLNEDVLRNLVKMFLVSPRDRGYDMKPSLTQRPEEDFNKQDFVPKRVVVEEVVEEEEYIVS
ncbi:28S ribosomal protein S30, mitochondrial [Elysia marginata]|uniref:28S ribosomal protein S30, mitochondrial n=1 Tax=Elysia marginata TaxID=1093978 RepID=A0AAV4HM68_9GAST|nr:28S ribosomal protein S30, mitochondrial [Elysia marginata]